jgi:hypothetical protein
MKRSMQQLLSATMPFVMLTVLTASQAAAEEHIVPLTELQGQIRTAAEQRAKNLEDIQRVLSYPAAAAALKKSNVSQDQMRMAVATLSDDELVRLSDRARASEKDVEGGLIVGILALIGLVVVILIVIAVVAKAEVPAPALSLSA